MQYYDEQYSAKTDFVYSAMNRQQGPDWTRSQKNNYITAVMRYGNIFYFEFHHIILAVSICNCTREKLRQNLFLMFLKILYVVNFSCFKASNHG